MKTPRRPLRCPRPLALALACAALLPGAAAAAGDPMIDLINAYRAAPPPCDGRRAPALAPLVSDARLARIQVGTGTILEYALERAGIAAARAEAIHVAGAADAAAVMATIAPQYCRTLQSAQFSRAGVRRNGDSWLLLFVEPAVPAPLVPAPDLAGADLAILAAVNAARAQPRRCGEQAFDAARELVWNATLAATALVHSEDMARQAYFEHQGKDGRRVSDRARALGYRWRTIAENIAVGQNSAQEVVDGWLASPGHCANIMQPAFTEMGAAHAINSDRRIARVYWTQVLGVPP